MYTNRSLNTFFALLRAGLWEQGICLSDYEPIDFSEIHQIAEDQSVVGILAAGLEQVKDRKLTKQEVLRFVGPALKMEQRNIAMNNFIAATVEAMRTADLNPVVVKGQGIAQCYEKPLWRTSGDIDFLLDQSDYEKAKSILIPLASDVDPEDASRLHQGMTVDSWLVELHGTMHTVISHRVNRVIDQAQRDIFHFGGMRCWKNNTVDVFLPNADNDVIIVFTHFINHFYGSGVGLRQICDWCRLLWRFDNNINKDILKERISEMGLMQEWKAFAAFAVIHLGMPESAMPFFDSSLSYCRKADRICKLIIKAGNLGQNVDETYRVNTPKTLSNVITFFQRLKEFAVLTAVFPSHSPKFFITYVMGRIKKVLLTK